MTEAVRLAYAQGFMDKCAEAGLDAEKAAQDTLRDAAGGALSGGAVGGAAVGGAHAYDALIRKNLGLSDNAASVAHWFANKLPGLTEGMSRDDQLMLKLWKATRAIKGRPTAVIGGLAGLGALSHMATGGGRGTKAAQFSLGADSNRNSALGTAGATALGTVPAPAMTEAAKIAYTEGFMAKCAAAGLDPEKVAQAALGNPPTRTGAYTAAALNPLTGGLSAPIYAGAKSDSVGKGVGNMFATPIAMGAGAVPGAALMGMGQRQLDKAVKPVTSMASGARVGHAVVDAAGHVGGKAKIIAGLIAALTGAGIAGGETTYALSKRT